MAIIYRATASQHIQITLEQKDWNKDWRGFVNSIKLIPNWFYDGETKTWFIPNSDVNFEILGGFVNTFLSDKNPLELGELFQ